MNKRDLERASEWAKKVGAWVGDSPKKAASFGLLCAFVGAALALWAS